MRKHLVSRTISPVRGHNDRAQSNHSGRGASQLLDYCPEAGMFVWHPRQNTPVSWNTKYAGKVAGSPRGTGVGLYR